MNQPLDRYGICPSCGEDYSAVPGLYECPDCPEEGRCPECGQSLTEGSGHTLCPNCDQQEAP